MKIFTAPQVKALDRRTIAEQSLQSIELMERAAATFTEFFTREFDYRQPVQIFCGIGDNGGDGLAIGRLLFEKDYKVRVYILRFSNKMSKDFRTNLDRLRYRGVEIVEVEPGQSLEGLSPRAIGIDAILGSGLSRPIEGWLAKIIQQINTNIQHIISVDIASGLFADEHTDNISILPKQTFCFESPKLAFFFPENYERVGEWIVKSINSSVKGIEETTTPYHYITPEMIHQTYRPRSKFSHKGTYGRALLIVGSHGMMGAGVLATHACIRSGVGLTTTHIPQSGYSIIQTAIPEAMASIDPHNLYFTQIPELDRYKAIGIGCGISQAQETQEAFEKFLKVVEKPLVIDADALNIIAANNWHELIPKNSIITPHPGEFKRLFGKMDNDFQQNNTLRKMAKELGIYIILKGAHSSIACPDGSCYFNSTGNPGMATGGSGDVLTGILTALLAQGYSPKDASLLGVYLHGLAGDLAAEKFGYEAMTATDIVKHIGSSFQIILKKKKGKK